MRIPRYWASAKGDGTGHHGPVKVKCFGHSDSSVEEARANAEGVVARLLAHIRTQGGLPDTYGYTGDRPIKEEILSEVKDHAGSVLGVVTRNGYGAEVLNTRNVLFADIDDPPTKGAGLVASLKALFGGAKPAPEPPVPESVTRYAEANPQAGLRLYRTRKGWRVIIVNEAFEPDTDRTNEVLVGLASDPDYIRLTRIQRCFRARLTPKPWRCGEQKPLRDFPREDPRLAKLHQDWVRHYEAKCARFATCRFVAELGRGRDTAAASTIISLHDRATKATSGLALA
jgi:hypothetical protein